MRFLFVLGATLLSVVSAATSCWEFARSASLQTASVADTGMGCVVDVTIPLVAASYVPNEPIALLWGVRLEAQSTNSMNVPMPPDTMAPLSSDNADASVQILSTYVRTCAFPTQCSPWSTGNDTFTRAQSGNFSNFETTYFHSLDDLSFAEKGMYTVAAVAVLGNADDATLLYYFQTFVNLVVMDVLVEAKEYDTVTTYCHVTVQNPLENYLDSNRLLASSDSSEIDVVIDTNGVVQVNQAFDVVWAASMTRNTSKEIQLPTVLTAVYVPVDYSTEQSGYYTIVSSIVKLCKREMDCDEYSRTITVTSSALSANFTATNTAMFTTRDIVVPLTGWYRGFAQVTLAGPADSQRYDFIKYFEIFATEENMTEFVENQEFVKDGRESYCWHTFAPANDKNVDATSVMFTGNSSICPYTITLNVSETTCTVDTGTLVNWTVAKKSLLTGIDGVTVNTTTVYDASSGQYVNVPQVNIYYCNETTCSPFSKKKIRVHSAQPMNFSDKSCEASYTATISIPREGLYALMAHAVVSNGDGLRFDVASFMKVSVTASSASAVTSASSSSGVWRIAGLTLGCVALVCLAIPASRVFCCRRQQKGCGFSFFGFRPLSNINEHPTTSPNSIHNSDESGNFMYAKAQRSPLDMPRAFSLSYNPSSRPSVGNEDSGYSFTLSESDHQRPSSIDRTILLNACDAQFPGAYPR